MTTGSECFTEILMSRKPCSSNREASHRALSTSACAVGRPCLRSTRASSDPALTPIRIGTPASDAARAISRTLSSNALMLPGFTRTPAQPASMAAKTYLGWKWISAITGIGDLRAIWGRASTSSCDGTATRTIWQPAAVSSAICWRVASTSAVSVVVIDCTVTGASPPTATDPTRTCRDRRRAAIGSGGAAGMPRSVAVIVVFGSNGRDRRRRTGSAERVRHGGDDVGEQEQHRQPDDQRHHEVCSGQQLGEVDATRVAAPERPRDPRPGLLERQDRQVPAVERQQGQQVEDADEDVEPGHEQQEGGDLLGGRRAGLQRLATYPGRADGADEAAGVPRAVVQGLIPQLRHRGGDRDERLTRVP